MTVLVDTSAIYALVDRDDENQSPQHLPVLELVWIDEHTHRAAAAASIASENSSVSLVDWTSFEVMRQRGINRAFAFDDDFATQ